MGLSSGPSGGRKSSANLTFSVFKNFPIKEGLKFRFRFETFGLFNHTNFGNPSATIVRQHHWCEWRPYHPARWESAVLTKP